MDIEEQKSKHKEMMQALKPGDKYLGGIVLKIDGPKCVIKKDKKTKVVTLNYEPSLTDQQWVEEVDVNKIMAKYRSGDIITHISRKRGTYQDLTYVKDLYEGTNNIHDMEKEWRKMSKKIKQRFANPAELVNFLRDPANKEEAISLGLIEGETNVEVVETTTPVEKPVGDSSADNAKA